MNIAEKRYAISTNSSNPIRLFLRAYREKVQEAAKPRENGFCAEPNKNAPSPPKPVNEDATKTN